MRLKVEITEELIEKSVMGDSQFCVIGRIINGVIDRNLAAGRARIGDVGHIGYFLLVKDYSDNWGIIYRDRFPYKLPNKLCKMADRFEGWRVGSVKPCTVVIEVPAKYLSKEAKEYAKAQRLQKGPAYRPAIV